MYREIEHLRAEQLFGILDAQKSVTTLLRQIMFDDIVSLGWPVLGG